MTDSTLVLKPGQQITDTNGTPQSGATLEFYDAGTSNARTVYSDSGLATSIGAIVTCDSGGYPAVSDVNTLIYTGVTAYKIITKDSDGVVLPAWTHDNIKGALDTSTFLTGAVTSSTPIATTSDGFTTDADDKGKLFNLNCSGASVNVVLHSAIEAGDGYPIGFRHDGTANTIIIRSSSSQPIKGLGYSGQVITLRSLGETVWLGADGSSGWTVTAYVPPFVSRDIPLIRITDRLSAPPGSPITGARYIATGTLAGDWTSFAADDILEYDGLSGWIRYTPTADCGWLAYVIDEDVNYQYQASGWVKFNNVKRYSSVIHVQERFSSGIGTGSITFGSAQIRPLNTVVKNNISGASLASNKVTLPAGEYEIWGNGFAGESDQHKVQWYNVTDSTIALYGCNATAQNDTIGTGMSLSWVMGSFTISAEKEFQLRHEGAANGVFGEAASFGEPEIYADVFIRQQVPG